MRCCSPVHARAISPRFFAAAMRWNAMRDALELRKISQVKALRRNANFVLWRALSSAQARPPAEASGLYGLRVSERVRMQ